MPTRSSDVTRDPRTVVGVDGSGHSWNAVLWGAAEAKRHGQSLLLVHAADLDRLDRFASFETSEHVRDAGHAVLTRTADGVRQRFPGLDVQVKLSRRKPVPALHAAVRPGSTIVVGSRGSGGFGPLLLGSTGLEVVIGSPAPVVVVRGDLERAGAAVTAAVRDEDDARWLVRAAQQARARDCPLRLVNVRSLAARFGGGTEWAAETEQAGGTAWAEETGGTEQAGGTGEAERTAEASGTGDTRDIGPARGPGPAGEPEAAPLGGTSHGEGPEDRLLAGLASRMRAEVPGLVVRTEVIAARSAASALVEASRSADLLVMGSHERRGYSVLGLGHVAHALLHHAHCPVEIVPYRRNYESGVVEEGLTDDEG
ncbi:universal stress protein [Streptomyces sp. NPDC006296]|uniref:universal stress protein n=1 Tax=Streptomyces sp. NPDC006296 TaxID=3156746 RepID=UPI0033A95376